MPKDDPKSLYLAHAARCFAAQGYHGTSLAAVAREAGVTKQALLHFFGTKERLYAQVLSDLSDRQQAEIAAAHHPHPKTHLLMYFRRFRQMALSQPQDSRLVVAALLDSNDQARFWPMKPYLDALVRLVQAMPAGQDLSDDAARARVFQLIGAIQYLAIGLPTIRGMYGSDAALAVASQYDALITEAILALDQPVTT